ncbi:hypothetical protein LR48_Vigan07g194900 [Vigna angularis]|uniref:Uncharacterized protein n=1 Tax=Phaseolus angularis TaxID=3914 RepID=A0A0L9UZF0_PHAAN|nr:hypothetical protein LR48_Vigan07g194900 [Vigna angularis]
MGARHVSGSSLPKIRVQNWERASPYVPASAAVEKKLVVVEFCRWCDGTEEEDGGHGGIAIGFREWRRSSVASMAAFGSLCFFAGSDARRSGAAAVDDGTAEAERRLTALAARVFVEKVEDDAHGSGLRWRVLTGSLVSARISDVASSEWFNLLVVDCYVA